MENKLQIGIISLSGCEGCCFAVLDMPKQFLQLSQKVEIKNFRLFEENIHLENEKFDCCFFDGTPLTQENIEQVKLIRKNSKVVVAMGSCAHIGGIYHLKNYEDKAKVYKHVYHNEKTIENFDVKPLSEFIKVDFNIPGCPINAQEFFNFLNKLIIGKNFNIEQSPVCYECQMRGYECVLQKGEICLGPITQAGCQAVCLKSKQGCWGCRGLVEDAEVENLLKQLKQNHSEKEVKQSLEIFGVESLIKDR